MIVGVIIINIDEFLVYFDGKKQRIKNGYNVVCPCHLDNTPSLSITSDSDKILLHCHAGCSTEDILNEIGLTLKDLFTNPIENKSNWVNKIENFKNKKVIATYEYLDHNSNYLYHKVRFEDKSFIFGTLDKEKGFFNMGLDKPKTLYNLPYLLQAIEKGYPVYIVEGEKDVHTLSSMGYCATTCGGVNDWKKSYAKYFIGAKVVILPDNDDMGKELSTQIKKDLKNFAHSIKCGTISKLAKGDITDYIEKEKGTAESFKTFISGLEEEFAPWIYHTDKGVIKINQDKLATCIADTMEYLLVKHKGTEKEDIYLYENGVYNISNKNNVKGAIKRYLPIGLATDNLLNNVYNLLLCMNSKSYTIEQLNTDTNYINLKNGLYDIKQDKLIPHTPEILSTIQLNCNYVKDYEKPPKWLAYLKDLCRDENGNVDKEKAHLLQEWLGLIISNIPVYRVKSCLILFSSLGDTGKSIYLNIITYLLGTYNTINIPIQKLSDNFSLSGAYGKRAIVVGDQKSEDIKDSSIFKQITGGDSLEIEFKGKTKFSYLFNGGLIIACNDLPNFTDDKGGHIFNRLCIVPCTNVIPKDKRNGNLFNELLEEIDLIFMWALKGLKRLIKNDFKFTVCEASEQAKIEFREKNDTLFNFINENYIITDDKMDRVRKPEFESDYMKWCQENERTPMTKRNIKNRMNKIGCPYKKSGGYEYYQYLILDIISDENPMSDEEAKDIFK